MVTFRLDIVLSPFLHTVDDGFRDFWSNASYPLADSFLQLCDSLGNVYMYIFLYLITEKKIGHWKIWRLNWLFNIPNQRVSFPWNLSRRNDMREQKSNIWLFNGQILQTKFALETGERRVFLFERRCSHIIQLNS